MFCSNCGKEIREGANFCMYCGASTGVDIMDAEYIEIKDEEYTNSTKEINKYDINEYSNCKNGKVSLLKIFQKFFSRDIKEYFSFEGTYSRLEYFYLNIIINIFIVFIQCIDDGLHFIIIPLYIVAFWMCVASGIKRLKDLDFSPWDILIPLICFPIIAFNSGNKDGVPLIPAILLIFYQIYTLFVPGKKFDNKNNKQYKNDKKEDKHEEMSALAWHSGIIIGTILIFIVAIATLQEVKPG